MPSIEETIESVREGIKRGDVITAWDTAAERLGAADESVELRYWGVLALARAGATDQALTQYAPLARALEREVPRKLRIRIASLYARLLKDRALTGPDEARLGRLAEAAAEYERVFRFDPDPFPGVNASTLWMLARERERGRAIAAEVGRLCAGQAPQDPGEEYYLRASQAEAAIALGDLSAARTALERAAATVGADYTALAGTRKQLRLLCDAEGISVDLLESLEAPAVAYYLGPSEAASLTEAKQREVRARIERALDEGRVRFAFGSLAAGADILFAEAVLDRGVELNVVFPFEIEEYRRTVVGPAGADWVARFDRCLAAANQPIHFATTDAYLGDEGLFLYASRMAMGLAISKSRTLDAEARLMVVRKVSPAGAAPDFVARESAFWAGAGRTVDEIDAVEVAVTPGEVSVSPEGGGPAGRVVKALLFGDVKGFSKLREAQLPIFAREVLGRFSRVLESFGAKVPVKNTWGDALYVVAEDAVTGADCALALQDAMHELDPEALGLPTHIGLRLGGHVGPVFPIDDPVLGYRSYMGVHVSRTARIEPITPVGSVYVTEAFAASLALDRSGRFSTEYVGHIPAAKDWGRMRMYVLRRTAAPKAS